MSHPTSTPRHPLLACADTIEKALAAVLDCDPAYLSPDDKAELLLRLTRLLSQQEALRLRTVAAAGDLAAEHGCRRVADWLAPRTHTDRRAAHAQEKLAHALDARWPRVGAAVADGRMHLDQARVILTALDACPPTSVWRSPSWPSGGWSSTPTSSGPPTWPGSAGGSSTSSHPRSARTRNAGRWSGPNRGPTP